MLDVPVFWPILLCYWIFLFVLTMKRQILHMIKYKYVPFNSGKPVSSLIIQQIATAVIFVGHLTRMISLFFLKLSLLFTDVR